MTLQNWWLFVCATFLISAMPGPNMLHVMTQGMRHGLARAVFTMAGCMLALLSLFGLSAMGMSALLSALPQLLTAIKVAGALYLKKHPQVLDQTASMIIFAFLINLVHATAEVLVVIPFYFGNQLKDTYYSKGFFLSVVLLVGVGTVIHGLVDFLIARAVWVPLKNMTRRNLQVPSHN